MYGQTTHNSVSDFMKVYSYIVLTTTCFGCSYEPPSGWLLFLRKVKYTISNAIVLLPTRSLITRKKLKVKSIALYNNIKIQI